MAKPRRRADEPDIIELMAMIAHEVGTLAGQQVQLLRSEVRQELAQAARAAAGLGAGAGLAALGGLFTAVAAVHALHRATRLPLWACYGLLGTSLGGLGLGLIAAGRREAADVHLLPPPQTAAALRENLAWLRELANPTG